MFSAKTASRMARENPLASASVLNSTRKSNETVKYCWGIGESLASIELCGPALIAGTD